MGVLWTGIPKAGGRGFFRLGSLEGGVGGLGSLEFLKARKDGGGGGGGKMLMPPIVDYVCPADCFGRWDWLYFAESFATSVICSATVFPTQSHQHINSALR